MVFDDFVRQVEKSFEIPKKSIFEKSRRNDVVLARCVVFCAMRKLGMSNSSIARKFSMTPASVMHGMKLIQNKRETNAIVSYLMNLLDREEVAIC